MSRVRLYIDEDAAERAVVDSLRNMGVDLLTVFEAGMDRHDDHVQLLFAANDGRVLYTLNVGDFCRLHQDFLTRQQEHAGIIVIPRQRYATGEKVRRLYKWIESMTAEQMRNRLEFL